MRYIEVGSVRVSALGLSLPKLLEWEDIRKSVRRGLDLGVNLIQLQEFPVLRVQQRPLGEIIRGSEVFVATPAPPAPFWPTTARRISLVRGLAERLGTEAVVVIQMRWIGRRDIARVRSFLDSGAVRYTGAVGLSVDKWQQIERELGSSVLFNSTYFNLTPSKATEPARDLVPFARDAGRIIMAQPYLGKVIYSEAVSGRETDWWDQTGGEPGYGDLRSAVKSVAHAHGATPNQVALAWLMHFPNVVALTLYAEAAAIDLELSDSEHSMLTDLAGHK